MSLKVSLIACKTGLTLAVILLLSLIHSTPVIGSVCSFSCYEQDPIHSYDIAQDPDDPKGAYCGYNSYGAYECYCSPYPWIDDEYQKRYRCIVTYQPYGDSIYYDNVYKYCCSCDLEINHFEPSTYIITDETPVTFTGAFTDHPGTEMKWRLTLPNGEESSGTCVAPNSYPVGQCKVSAVWDTTALPPGKFSAKLLVTAADENCVETYETSVTLPCEMSISSFVADSYVLDPGVTQSITLSANIISNSNNISWRLDSNDALVASGTGALVSAELSKSNLQIGENLITLKADGEFCNDEQVVNIYYPPCDLKVNSFASSKSPFDPSSGEVTNLVSSITSSRAYSWTIDVSGRRFVGDDVPSVEWDGKDSVGSFVSDGTYAALLKARSLDGQCSASAMAQVDVKRRTPTICPVPFNSTVHPATGNLTHNQELFSLKGGSLPTSLSLTYDSLSPRSTPVGTDLIHQFQKALHVQDDQSILYREWDRERVYLPSESGYLPPPGDTSTLIKNPDGSYEVTEADGTVSGFDTIGRVVSTIEATGKSYSFSYTADSVTIVDPNNISTTFSQLYYNSLRPFTGSIGNGWSHSYDIALQDQGNGAIVFTDSGKIRLYTPSGDGYASPLGDHSTLSRNPDGTFVITERDGLEHNFDQWGRITSRTDQHGSSMTFTYEDGNLSGVVDGAGRRTTFEYDAESLTRILDPKGNIYSFGYEGVSLTSVTHPDGGVWQYTYDPDGFLLTKTDPGGNSVSYIYDTAHRAISSSDPEGRTRNLDYAVPVTDSIKTTTFEEKDGGSWRYTYNTSTGTLTSKTDPMGNTTRYTYDSRNNMISKTEPLLGTTTYVYDDENNLRWITDPLGNTTSYTYNDHGQILTTSGPQGTVTSTYDENGNLLTTTGPTGPVTSYEYDPKGNLIKTTNAKSLSTHSLPY